MADTLKPFVMREPRIGVFFGAFEWYWNEFGMKDLEATLIADAKRFNGLLTDQDLDVIDSGVVTSHEAAAAAGKFFRDEKVDMVVFYHSTYIDDKVTYAFLKEYGDGPLVLAHSQGMDSIPEDFSLVDYARCWGNNSSVQIISSARRMHPNRHIGYTFGHMPEIVKQVASYARAARAMANVRKCNIAYLPHRCNGAPMYDTFPDEAQMMSQTGVSITFAYIHDVVEEMEKVTTEEEQLMVRDMLDKYRLIEPSMEELHVSVRLAIALERVVAKYNLDAVAVDAFPELGYRAHQLPNIAQDLLMDHGIVVACEGDLTAMVAGLYMREFTGEAPTFWEHLMFDVERNWVLGGHDGGCAGFNKAADPMKVTLRSMMYVDFHNCSPPLPPMGLAPEFIQRPGRITWINLFRDTQGYAMRTASGESVDTSARPVHHEHLIFKPDLPLEVYFRNMMRCGVDHHFMIGWGNWSQDFERLAELLNMPIVNLTAAQ